MNAWVGTGREGMADEATPQATAAEATIGTTTSTDGVKPSAAETTTTSTPAAGAPMSAAQAREILRQARSTGEPSHRDPLLNGGDGEGRDPLLDDLNAEDDPLLNGLDLTGVEDEAEPETEGVTPPEEGEAEGESETSEEENTEEEAEAEESEEGAGKKGDRKRIRLRLDKMPVRDAAIIRLAHEKGITLDEARQQLFGEAGDGAHGTDRTNGTTQAEAKAVATANTLEQELAALEADLEKAGEALDTPQMAKLQNQIRRKERELAEAMAREGASQLRQQSQRAALELQSYERTVARWPDAAVEGSKLFSAIATEVNRLHASNPAVFNDPEWREAVTAKVAVRLGISPKAAAPAKPEAASAKVQKPATAAVPKKKATPVPKPGAGGYATTPAQPSAQQIQHQIATAQKAGDVKALGNLIKQLQAAG